MLSGQVKGEGQGNPERLSYIEILQAIRIPGQGDGEIDISYKDLYNFAGRVYFGAHFAPVGDVCIRLGALGTLRLPCGSLFHFCSIHLALFSSFWSALSQFQVFFCSSWFVSWLLLFLLAPFSSALLRCRSQVTPSGSFFVLLLL